MPPDDSHLSPTPEQLLAWGRGERAPFPREATVPEVFAGWVRDQPEAAAVWEGERRWSYVELAGAAARVAEVLRSAEVPPRSFVGVPSARSAAFVAAALGILQAGCAYLPVDESEPPDRRRLRERDCAALLHAGPAGWEVRRGEGTPETSGAGAESPAYLLYTSGSTGTPKGVIVPHRAITRLVCGADYLTIRPDDVFAFHSNTSFDASTLELWGPLLNGASLVVTPTETVLSPEALAAHLWQHGITTLWLTTSLFAQLAEEAPGLFGSLRTLIFGGEAADREAVRRVCAHGRPQSMVNGYGPTESTTFAVCHRLGDLEGERIPIGRPIANTDALVLDAGLQPAVEGELFLGGDGLALGYRNAPELTAERFPRTAYGRLYRTGDLVRWRADGTLDYLGRIDRQVKIRGFRIEPGEVEAALRQVAGVTRGAVLPREAPSGEPCLVAWFTGTAAPEAVRAELKRVLPAQMVPAVCRHVDLLPLTANGKLDERALPPPFPARGASPGPEPAASTNAEKIAAAWRQVLGLESVGQDDNFFDLGGTSLSLLRVFRLLHSQPGMMKLRVVALFQHPTVRALAAFLEVGASTWTPGAALARAEKQRAGVARRRLY